MRHALRALAATAVFLTVALGVASGTAAAPATAAIPLPRSNVPAGSPAVSDTLVAYVLADPLVHVSTIATAGSWAGFRNRVFTVGLRATDGGGLVAGTPHQIYEGPLGDIVQPCSSSGGWLVYNQYPDRDAAGPWILAARNLATGRVVMLDTPAREGVPSLVTQAASDGHTVAWQSWTTLQGQVTSVIRTYDLATGQRRLLAQGGSPTTWSYDWPSVSGTNVVFEKQQLRRLSPHIQIFVASLATGDLRTLTGADGTNSEPSISGSLVAWKQGARFGEGHGVGYHDLRTGASGAFPASQTEEPLASAGRYIVYPSTPYAHAESWNTVLYDTRARTRTILATGTGNAMLAGEDVVGYWGDAIHVRLLPR